WLVARLTRASATRWPGVELSTEGLVARLCPAGAAKSKREDTSPGLRQAGLRSAPDSSCSTVRRRRFDSARAAGSSNSQLREAVRRDLLDFALESKLWRVP